MAISAQDKILHVANNFKELEEYQGRFLKDIYMHKKEKDQEDDQACLKAAETKF